MQQVFQRRTTGRTKSHGRKCSERHIKGASIIHIAAHGHMDDADIFLACYSLGNEGVPKTSK